MDKTLLGSRIGRWRIPCRRQIVGKLEETCAIDLWARRRHGGELLDSPLEFGHTLQCGVPARLQFAGDVALLRVHQLVSTARQRRFVTGRFKLSLDGDDDVLPRALDLIRSKDGGFHGAVGHRLENLQSDRAINPHASDADTQPRAHMGVIAAALIAMSVAFAHAIEDPHHSSAPTAPHQPGKQRVTAARRFARAILLHVRVLKQELLIVLVLLPADVARMIVAQ